jgi:hypothetical protein
MGTQLNAQGDPNQPYVKAAENYMRLMFEYNFNFWNWIPGVWKLTGKEAEQKGLLKTLLGFTQKVRRCFGQSQLFSISGSQRKI